MRTWKRWSLVCAIATCGALGVRAMAQDAADEVFDTPEVKEMAARADAMKLDDQIALIRRVQASIDRRLLTPPDAAWKAFEDLRGRTDAGLARMLERGLYEKIVSPRGGGAYWSFTKRSNSYDEHPQVQLQQGRFSSGFHGGAFGTVTALDATDLRSVTASSVPEGFRAPYEAARDAATCARKDGVDSAEAKDGGVYAVRSAYVDGYDVLAAFQVVAKDAQGVTIAWRILEQYPTPARPPRQPGQEGQPGWPGKPGEGGKGGGGGAGGAGGAGGEGGR